MLVGVRPLLDLLSKVTQIKWMAQSSPCHHTIFTTQAPLAANTPHPQPAAHQCPWLSVLSSSFSFVLVSPFQLFVLPWLVSGDLALCILAAGDRFGRVWFGGDELGGDGLGGNGL